jgi:DNA repair protein RecN (Recombination protein N)
LVSIRFRHVERVLTHIHIRDFVIVDALELEFESGMTALTGETGAGKSVLVDALGLVIGDRASADVVRHGCERAEIVASFDISDQAETQAWLASHDLDDGAECLVRRVIGREGRSRAYINGSSVPNQLLRKFGEGLIDIHGQHEHQSLMHRNVQRQLLDSYAGTLDEVAALGESFRQWRARQEALAALREARQQRSEHIDLLEFQIQELTELGLAEGEIESIEAEHARLANAGRLLETCHRTLDSLYEDEASAYGTLSHAVGELVELAALDGALAPAGELLNNALILIQEAVDDLRRYGDGLDLDPARLAWLDGRLGAVQRLARKYRVMPAELPRVLEQARQEREQLEHADEHIETLQAECDARQADYDRQATRLSKARRQAAERLGREISDTMATLGMQGGNLSAKVETLTQDHSTPSGRDQVEFLVSANPGQPLMPLARVASGGELSRISLAIQVASKGAAIIPTLIFDEVDSGIGGRVAEVVGRRLRELGSARQVFCVTHLPQVAAQAHHHLHVAKLTGRASTHTRISPLSEEQRIEEIARMLGGVEVTESTRVHAREMIERAGQAGVPGAASTAGGSRRQKA